MPYLNIATVPLNFARFRSYAHRYGNQIEHIQISFTNDPGHKQFVIQMQYPLDDEAFDYLVEQSMLYFEEIGIVRHKHYAPSVKKDAERTFIIIPVVRRS